MSDDIKMNGELLDINEQHRGELKQLFPGVFTETLRDDGQPDFERLKANAMQTFKSRSQNSETEMVFKVV